MLHSPELHEPLTDRAWDEAWVRDRIRAIVAGADRAHDPASLWPGAEWDSWQLTTPLKSFYVGAAGVIWALDTLRRRGHAETGIDLAHAATHTLELWAEQPDFWPDEELMPERQASLLCGESGLLLAAWRVSASAELADRLHARVRENVPNNAVEVMWGSPGTMLAARAMHAWTGEDRWLDAWNESAAELRRRRGEDDLWESRLYGNTFRSLTPPHGLTGIVGALLEEPDEELERDTARILAETAVREDGLASWPSRPGGDLTAQDGQIRLQWCVGSPGIVIAAGSYLDEELLLAGAECIWQAGPHGAEKGHGICHGTAGNGYALLKTFARTQDERWLERARRFAVHALEQVERSTGRYSLYTGDVGAALFAADCLDARPRYPVTDAL